MKSQRSRYHEEVTVNLDTTVIQDIPLSPGEMLAQKKSRIEQISSANAQIKRSLEEIFAFLVAASLASIRITMSQSIEGVQRAVTLIFLLSAIGQVCLFLVQPK